jgi:hypothetical protein
MYIAFTWIYVNSCEFVSMYMNQNNFIWMCMNLHEYLRDSFNFISNDLTYSECKSLHKLCEYILNLFERCAHCLTAAHNRTARQPHTAARTAGQPHTAACTAAPCRTLPRVLPDTTALPHTAWIKMPNTTHRTLQTAHIRTPQLACISNNLMLIRNLYAFIPI